MAAIFVMTATTAIVVGILDTEILQYSSLRNTINYDRARYLAEAGIAHALAELEHDIEWNHNLSNIQFPSATQTYSATLTRFQTGEDWFIVINATGTSQNQVRNLRVVTRYGGG
jgi:type II secretory pathway component PulK